MKKLLSTICAFALTFGCVLGATSCGNKTNDDNNKSSDVLKLVNVNLTEESYAYAINKGNSELKDSFNSYLTEIKSNGTFDLIKKKYLEGEGEKVGLNVSETVSAGDSSTGSTADKLVVLTNTNFEPFEFVGESDGKYYGIDMEIVKGFAESQNKEIYLIEWIDFDSIVNQANQYANAIVAAGLTYDEDRAEIVDFTQTYFTTSQVIIAKAEDTTFDNCTTAEDVTAIISGMTNKKFGFQNGTQGAWFVDEYKNITPSGYKTAALAGQALANGSIDYLVVDAEPAKAIVKAINEMNK